ncbi:YbaB/EbfC family nucleoid-associated protein [Actinoallomurus sp. NPDC052308]|uniref:YbaB/EbfC family nucleoid-associated protein n=1 Tax=Actinoallomurus sp. NPDC052308 TaxID=3155530 RepID=UPI00343039FA
MDLRSAEVDDLISRTRNVLESLGTAGSGGAREVRGVGESPDGRVKAVAVAGHIESLELDPRVMRMPSQELAEHITAAVNAALDGLAAQPPPAEQPALPRPEVIAAQLAEIQEQSVRQLAAISEAISAAVRQAQEAM